MSSRPITDEEAVAAADKEMEERANRAKELLSRRYVGLKRSQVGPIYCSAPSVETTCALFCTHFINYFSYVWYTKQHNILLRSILVTIGGPPRPQNAPRTPNDRFGRRQETTTSSPFGARRNAHSKGITKTGHDGRFRIAGGDRTRRLW